VYDIPGPCKGLKKDLNEGRYLELLCMTNSDDEVQQCSERGLKNKKMGILDN